MCLRLKLHRRDVPHTRVHHWLGARRSNVRSPRVYPWHPSDPWHPSRPPRARRLSCTPCRAARAAPPSKPPLALPVACRWLSAFGVEEGHLSAQRMALVTSTYWGAMCIGRFAWTCLSGLVASTWPMLFFDLSASLVAALILVW